MPDTSLEQLKAAICTTHPDDPDAVDRLRQQLLQAVPDPDEVETSDAVAAESLLSCIVESFVRAGEPGKELLDQLLLEVTPHLAALASVSEGCAEKLTGFCSLAAAACSPRDTITAFLEVMDQHIADRSVNPHTLQFLCSLLGLLPQQLGKLQRRKAAFTIECLMPAAALAKMHGEVLGSWMLLQLQQAAQLPTAGDGAAGPSAAAAAAPSGNNTSAAERFAAVLKRVDTFLAANWQVYADFVDEVLHKVLPTEPASAARLEAQQAVKQLILHLLLNLTSNWQAPELSSMALQLLSQAAAAHLPSAESVTAPVAMLALKCGRGQADNAAAAAASQLVGSTEQGDVGAIAVVRDLLSLLLDCGVAGWCGFGDCTGDEAAGAALAVLYDSWTNPHTDRQLLGGQLPATAAGTLQLACRWAVALLQASDGSPLVILKAVAFLQLAAQHARMLQDSSAAALAAVDVAEPQPLPQQAAGAPDAADAAAAEQLLPDLQPCVGALASIIAQATVVPLRAQATLALQQTLGALHPAVHYHCLQQLLSGGKRAVHPEVAALLMQDLRLQLAKPGPAIFNSCSCVVMVLPWLQQSGAVGWQSPLLLAERANAICAALAVVRLALLKLMHNSAADVVARTTNSTDHDTSDSGSSSAGVCRQLQACLPALSSAVAAALQHLQTEDRAQEQQVQEQQQQQQECMPGEATGAGYAIDAWLAVSRVQDVLYRVVELSQQVC